jgi:hypothetical protein
VRFHVSILGGLLLDLELGDTEPTEETGSDSTDTANTISRFGFAGGSRVDTEIASDPMLDTIDI